MSTRIQSRHSASDAHPVALSYKGVERPLRDPIRYVGARSLRIDDCHPKLSLQNLLDILKVARNLEELTLTNAISPQASTEPNVHTITLPRLRTLILSHPPSVNQRILSHLRLPAARRVHLADDISGIEGPELFDLDEAFAAILPRDSGAVLPLLHTTTSVVFDVYRQSCDLTAYTVHDGESLRLSLYDSDDHPYFNALGGVCAQDLVTIFSSAPITHLEITAAFGEIPIHVFGSLLRAFPQLESLILTGRGNVDHLWVLLNPWHRAEPPCPYLKEIKIGEDDDWFFANDDFFVSLVSALSARAARGTRLTELCLYLMHESDNTDEYEVLHARYVPQIEALVNSVEYNNVECREYDMEEDMCL
ncbi:hypothetical protein C8Q76DRAFT_858673 [Earliella scabrosa]|nr:hypothetical protein C8Q76DRAFT_858673 [Earliella scabrosa]